MKAPVWHTLCCISSPNQRHQEQQGEKISLDITGVDHKPKIADTSMELGSAEAIEGVNSEIFSPLSPVAANEPAIGDKSIALDTTGAAERESGVFLARYDDLDMQICIIR